MEIDFEIMIAELEKYGFATSDKQKQQILIYKDLIQAENLKHNLTRLKTDHEIWGRLFLDGIIAYDPRHFFASETLLDIGSGAGIPGLLLQILFPHLKVSLIESEYQKCLFLAKVKEKLDLDNLSIYNQRAEVIDPEHREAFDIVTFRALGALNIFLEVSAPYVKVNGFLLIPKGKLAEHEVEQSFNSAKVLHLKPYDIESLQSITTYTLKTVVFQKKQITNLTYPRPWVRILKKPLN